MYELADFSGSEIQMPVQPVLSKEAASLLERLLVFYDRLAAQGSDDADLRRKGADANRRVGDIRAALGQFEQAQTAFLAAIDSYRLIEERAPNDDSVAVEIARVYNNLGELQMPAGSPEMARSFHMQAFETLQSPAKAIDASPALRYEMARTCHALGRGGRPPDMAFGAPPPRKGPFGNPPHGGPQPGPNHTPHNENRQYLLHAIGLLKGLVEEQPTVPDYQHMLACCYRDLPPAMPFPPGAQQTGQIDLAIEILERLAEDFPAMPVYRHDLAKTYLHAFPQLHAQEPRHRGSSTSRSPPHHSGASRRAPQCAQLCLDSGASSHGAIRDVSAWWPTGAAEQELRNALTLQSSLVARLPSVAPYKVWKAMIQNALAEPLIDRGHTKEACSTLEVCDRHAP